MRRLIIGTVYAMIYIPGAVFGYLIASLAISFYGSVASDFVAVFGGFGLMIAAPLCWYLAVSGPRGSACTLAYTVAWCLLIGTLFVIGRWEQGKPIEAAGGNVLWIAIGMLGIIYMIGVPVILWWRRNKWEKGSPA